MPALGDVTMPSLPLPAPSPTSPSATKSAAQSSKEEEGTIDCGNANADAIDYGKPSSPLLPTLPDVSVLLPEVREGRTFAINIGVGSLSD
eukprot:3666874-Pyramimonas_sp.AAC.1